MILNVLPESCGLTSNDSLRALRTSPSLYRDGRTRHDLRLLSRSRLSHTSLSHAASSTLHPSGRGTRRAMSASRHSSQRRKSSEEGMEDIFNCHLWLKRSFYLIVDEILYLCETHILKVLKTAEFYVKKYIYICCQL